MSFLAKASKSVRAATSVSRILLSATSLSLAIFGSAPKIAIAEGAPSV